MKRFWIIFVLGLILLTSCLEQSQASNNKANQNSSQRANNNKLPTNNPRPPTPRPTKTSLPRIRGCVVNATALFIRSGPGKHFSSVGHYVGGDCMTIRGRNFETTWINTDKGWVSAYYIDAQGDLTILPIKSASTPVVPIFTPITITTKSPTAKPKATKTVKPTPTKIKQTSDCHPSYPDVCIPSPPPDLDCADIPYRRFQVLSPDPHRFDGDHDGIGCER